MIRLQYELVLSYTVLGHSADFFFYFHPAYTTHQQVTDEHLSISQSGANSSLESSLFPGQRGLRVHASKGPLQVSYSATVEISHHIEDPSGIAEASIQDLPLEVLYYIYPSRYCQSDRLNNFANNLFGSLPQGYSRALAICNWVREHVTFRPNSSLSTTAAVDTLVERVGVCRDFAHLMIAICRACNMPARFVSGTDYGADPNLGPPDFHAYVEVYLDHRWYLFDPSGTAIPMGMMRLATGRDAADAAFATIFGSVFSEQPNIHVWSEQSASHGWSRPIHTSMALSTTTQIVKLA